MSEVEKTGETGARRRELVRLQIQVTVLAVVAVALAFLAVLV